MPAACHINCLAGVVLLIINLGAKNTCPSSKGGRLHPRKNAGVHLHVPRLQIRSLFQEFQGDMRARMHVL